MNAIPENLPSRPLDIGQTIHATWQSIQENHKALAIAVCVPLSIQIVLVLISALVYDSNYLSKEVWLLLLIQGLASVLVAVRCHQVLLLPESKTGVFLIPRWTWNDTWFALTSIVVMVAFAVTFLATMPLYATGFLWSGSSLLTSGISTVLSYLIMAPGYYVTARLVLALPVAAIEGRIDFAAAWERSKGNGWRLAVLSGAIPLVISALGDWISDIDKSVVTPAVLVLTNVLVVFEVAVISMAYKFLIKTADQ
jgi:hypothetical protein